MLNGLCGLMLIDKPLRRTSMDVCAAIRAKFRRAGAPKRLKVGHAGTLDPLATGLLVIMVGKATTLCNALMANQKEYQTVINLSAFSTTDDAEGERTTIEVNRPPTEPEIQATLVNFVGVIQQRPPIYSAMKVGGRRAYDLARQGEVFELQARPTTIHSIKICGFTWPLLDVTVVCGKGTYIRSLARDIGVALRTGGMLESLRRTRSGEFDVTNARTLASLPDVLSPTDLLSPANYGRPPSPASTS